MGAGGRPNLRTSRRLDLSWQEMPSGPQTLIYKPGMLASLPDGHQLPLLYLLQVELDGQQAILSLPSLPLLQSGDRGFFETDWGWEGKRRLARSLNYSLSALLIPSPARVVFTEFFTKGKYRGRGQRYRAPTGLAQTVQVRGALPLLPCSWDLYGQTQS